MSSYMCVHKVTQWLPSYYLHVKRVERLFYVHNIDNSMLCRKGQKIMLCVQYRYTDTFNAMSKWLKDYVMYTIYRYIQCCVKRVERNTLGYIRIQLVLMSKGSKEIH